MCSANVTWHQFGHVNQARITRHVETRRNATSQTHDIRHESGRS